MDTLQNLLYEISNALLIPTLIVLLGLAAYTVILAGGLLREAITRSSVRRAIVAARRDIPGAFDHLAACSSGIPKRFTSLHTAHAGEHSKILLDLENEIAASLSKLTWTTRIAPMLGLMGTLIPLGPALTGLASGDMSLLSGNLVVAFTATVIGVLIGCVAYTLNTVRRNWYDRDMLDLEFITELKQ